MLRRLVQLVLVSVAASGAVALARWALGRLAGEPGVPVPPAASNGADRSGRIPMSFDSWPAVPEAPQRSSG